MYHPRLHSETPQNRSSTATKREFMNINANAITSKKIPLHPTYFLSYGLDFILHILKYTLECARVVSFRPTAPQNSTSPLQLCKKWINRKSTVRNLVYKESALEFHEYKDRIITTKSTICEIPITSKISVQGSVTASNAYDPVHTSRAN